jgi:large subunit ribosomal protein L18
MKVAKNTTRIKRKAHIRKTLSGNTERPRLVVFRSNRYIYAQIIDDVEHKTITGMSDREIKAGKPVEKAAKLGKQIGDKAKELGVVKIVFDRNGYRYHGRIKAIADGAREAGLDF